MQIFLDAVAATLSEDEHAVSLAPVGGTDAGRTQASIACRVRCHGEDEGGVGSGEVIADRTRFPACREPGRSVCANQAGSGSETPRDPRIVA
ncbi:MAG: hypothetical protein R6V44_13540 [Paracoccaceae bacterium]